MKIQRTNHFLQGVLHQMVPDAIDPDRKNHIRKRKRISNKQLHNFLIDLSYIFIFILNKSKSVLPRNYLNFIIFSKKIRCAKSKCGCDISMNRKYCSSKKKPLNKATSSGYEQHTILIRARIKPIIQGQEPKADKNRRTREGKKRMYEY